MLTINELKANNDERDFFQFKTNFIRVQARVILSRLHCSNEVR